MKCQPTTLNRDLAALPSKFCAPKDISKSQNKKLEKEVQNLKKDLEKSKHDLDDAKSLLQTKVEEMEKLKVSRMVRSGVNHVTGGITESQNKKLKEEVRDLKKNLEKSKNDLDEAKRLQI